MGKYNFDEVIDRHGTDCLKYDFGMKRKGRDDLLPLWVADMDFRLPDEILDEFHKRIDHGIFGYTDPLDEYFATLIPITSPLAFNNAPPLLPPLIAASV